MNICALSVVICTQHVGDCNLQDRGHDVHGYLIPQWRY